MGGLLAGFCQLPWLFQLSDSVTSLLSLQTPSSSSLIPFSLKRKCYNFPAQETFPILRCHANRFQPQSPAKTRVIMVLLTPQHVPPPLICSFQASGCLAFQSQSLALVFPSSLLQLSSGGVSVPTTHPLPHTRARTRARLCSLQTNCWL